MNPLYDQHGNLLQPKEPKKPWYKRVFGFVTFSWQKFALVASALALIVGVIGNLEDFGEYVKKKQESWFPTAPPPLFTNDNTYNVLLLPFGTKEFCTTESQRYHLAVKNRLNELNGNQDLGMEIMALNTLNCNITNQVADSIGKHHKADLIIWGEYSTWCRWNTTLISINYLSLLDTVDLSVNIGIQGLSSFLVGDTTNAQIRKGLVANLLEKGQLTGRVEDVVYWAVGMRALDSENYDLALQNLKRIEIRDQPEYAIICLSIANVYTYLFDETSSFIYINQALDLQPEYVKALRARGSFYKNTKKYDLALEDFNKAIELNPTDANSYEARAWFYNAIGNRDLALEDFNRTIDLDPADASSYRARAWFFEGIGNRDLALEDFNRTIDLDPAVANSYRARAQFYEDINKTDLALEDLKKAIELDPIQESFYWERALLYHDIGKNDWALKDLNKAIKLDPTATYYYSYRAKLYWIALKLELALKDLNKAIELDPVDPYLYHLRVMLYMGYYKPKPELALKDLNKAIELDPVNPHYYGDRAMLYRIALKPELALKDLNKALELDPVNQFFLSMMVKFDETDNGSWNHPRIR